MPAPKTKKPGTNPTYRPDEKQFMIRAVGEGKPWSEIAAALGRTEDACQRAARRMRRCGEWPKDAEGVRELPSRRERPRGGRPPNRVRTEPISLRFAPEVETALREVADAAEIRLGRVIDEAIARALARRKRAPLDEHPLGLEPGKYERICDAPRLRTVSVHVESEPLHALGKICGAPAKTPLTLVVTEAAHELLADLHYRIVDCSRS